MVDIAKGASFPFVGPNCLGIYVPDYVDTFFLPGERITRPDKGNIGFVSQSGGVLQESFIFQNSVQNSILTVKNPGSEDQLFNGKINCSTAWKVIEKHKRQPWRI